MRRGKAVMWCEGRLTGGVQGGCGVGVDCQVGGKWAEVSG